MSDLIKTNQENDIVEFSEERIRNLQQTPQSIISYARQVITSKEAEELFENLPAEVVQDVKSQVFSSAFFQRIERGMTPFDFLKERKGWKNRDTGEYEMVEYFPEDYTISELNRLFPGWWTESMDWKIDTSMRTASVWGYLCVEYPSLKGMKVTKRWAIGSERIEFNKDESPTTGMKDASQPEDRVTAARTRWLKLAGKWFGIGLDIYHQRITPELRSWFEDTVRNWSVYGDRAKEIAATYETGHKFRNFIKSLPTLEMTADLLKFLSKIPDDLKDGENRNFKDEIWKSFVKLRIDTDEGRVKSRKFLNQIEVFSKKFETKI